MSADSREVALDLIEAVLAKRRLLDEAFDAVAGLGKMDERDRAFARALAATTLRRLGQIDDLLGRCLEHPLPVKAGRVRDVLRLGVAQLLFLGTPAHAAIDTSVEILKGTQLAGFAGLVNAVLRRLDREGRDWLAQQDVPRLNTPAWMWRSWVAAYGEEQARAIALANLTEAATDITVTGDPTLWADRLEARLMPTGSLRRAGHGDIARLSGFDEGVWWVQDMAAALPVRLLGEVKGQRVADLCAAPGGKAMQLAAAGALVTALDRSAARLGRFRENLARLGLEASIIEADATIWTPPSAFDAVLVDAPCSATGTLRRHPDGLCLKQPADVLKLAGLQARLLKAAAAMVKPGGLLVYCVCSLEPEEGLAQIESFLAAGAPFARLPVEADEVGGLAELITPAGDLRTLPCHLAEEGGMDAFFAARLKRAQA